MEPISSSFDSTLPAISTVEDEEKNEKLEKIHRTYITIVRELCTLATLQSIRFGEKSQTSTTSLRRNVRRENKDSSELQVKMGKVARDSGIGGFVLLGCQFIPTAFPNLFGAHAEFARNALRWGGETGVRNYSDMKTNYLGAEKAIHDTLLAMCQTDLQAQANKNSDNNMQGIQPLSDLMASFLQRAAASAG